MRATAGGSDKSMWDEDPDDGQPLSHDLPCPRCGHAAHTVLVCGSGCDCQPAPLPGTEVGRRVVT